MITDKNELFELYENLASMVLPDFQKFVVNILKDGNQSLKDFKLSKKELADFLETDIDEINKILEGNFSNVTLVTYLLVLIANNLTLDVHSLKAPYSHSSGKSNYDNIENGLNERQKKAFAKILGSSIADVEKFVYVHSKNKSKYNKIEKKLQEKKNEFLDALNQCKPDSKYLKELRELAKTNAGNEKLCNLIKYYTK